MFGEPCLSVVLGSSILASDRPVPCVAFCGSLGVIMPHICFPAVGRRLLLPQTVALSDDLRRGPSLQGSRHRNVRTSLL